MPTEQRTDNRIRNPPQREMFLTSEEIPSPEAGSRPNRHNDTQNSKAEPASHILGASAEDVALLVYFTSNESSPGRLERGRRIDCIGTNTDLPSVDTVPPTGQGHLADRSDRAYVRNRNTSAELSFRSTDARDSAQDRVDIAPDHVLTSQVLNTPDVSMGNQPQQDEGVSSGRYPYPRPTPPSVMSSQEPEGINGFQATPPSETNIPGKPQARNTSQSLRESRSAPGGEQHKSPVMNARSAVPYPESSAMQNETPPQSEPLVVKARYAFPTTRALYPPSFNERPATSKENPYAMYRNWTLLWLEA